MCLGIYNIISFVNFILGMFVIIEKFSIKMFVEFNENVFFYFLKIEVECIKVGYLKLDFLLLVIIRKDLYRLKYLGCCN